MSITPIQWTSNKHRWAVIRYFNNHSDTDLVSQHTSPHEAILRCQEWIQSDPWTFPDGDDTLNHYYDVEARGSAAALELALARQQIAAEDAAVGRVSRFPRFDEPGGKRLEPGEDDEPCEPIAWMLQVKATVSGPCQLPGQLRRGVSNVNITSCPRRSVLRN